MVKLWIPNWDLYQRKISKDTNAIVKYHGNNIIELRQIEDIQKVMSDIRKYEYIADNEIKSFFDKNFPDIKIGTVPIEMNELRIKLKTIFLDTPDDFFEETDAVKLFT